MIFLEVIENRMTISAVTMIIVRFSRALKVANAAIVTPSKITKKTVHNMSFFIF
jgi:hypothetical protein